MADDIIIPIRVDESKGLAQLRQFGRDAAKAVPGVNGPPGTINMHVNVRTHNAPADLSRLTMGAGQSKTALDKMSQSASSADNALLNLNQVIQDSPYGFMGISNNLNPLLESFQRLRTTTGSTSGALSAMAKGLMGGGGLGIAIAAISSALTFASIGLDMWMRKSKDAATATDELKNRQKEFESLVTSSNKTAGEQIGKLKALETVLNSNSTSVLQKKAALKTLEEIYPSYFKNLDLEDAKNGRVSDTIRTQLIPAIMAAAQARALQGRIDIIEGEKVLLLQKKAANNASMLANKKLLGADEKTKIKYDINFDGADALNQSIAKKNTGLDFTIKVKDNELKPLYNDLTELSKKLGKLKTDGTDVAAGVKEKKAKKTDAEKLTEAYKKHRAELAVELQLLQEDYDRDTINTETYLTKKIALLAGSKEKIRKEFSEPIDGSAVRELDTEINALASSLKTVAKAAENAKTPIADMMASAPTSVANLQVPVKIGPVPVPDPVGHKNKILEPLRKELQELGIETIEINGVKVSVETVLDESALKTNLDVVKSQTEQLRGAAAGAIADSVSTFAESIGSGEGLSAGINKVGIVLGNALKNYGQQLVKGGAAILAAKLALKSAMSNPYAMIIAGAALIAVGAAVTKRLEAKGKQPIAGFAEGGVITGPTLAWIGEGRRTSRNNPELALPLDRAKPLFADIIGNIMNKTGQYAPAMADYGSGYPAMIKLVADGDSLTGVLTRNINRQNRNY